MKFKKFLNEEFYFEEREENKEFYEEWLHLVLRDCKPFLKDWNKTDLTQLLYTGRSNPSFNDFFLKKIRTDRKPLNTSPKMQDKFDELFKDKFGIKPRSGGMFCTGRPSEARAYGKLHFAFPIGNYKIIWSDKVVDLFREYTDNTTPHPQAYFENNNIRHTWRWFINMIVVESEGSVYQYVDDMYENLYGFTKVENPPDKDKFMTEWVKKITDGVNFVLNKTIDSYKVGDLKGAIQSHNEIMLVCDQAYLVRAKSTFDELTLIRKLKDEI